MIAGGVSHFFFFGGGAAEESFFDGKEALLPSAEKAKMNILSQASLAARGRVGIPNGPPRWHTSNRRESR